MIKDEFVDDGELTKKAWEFLKSLAVERTNPFKTKDLFMVSTPINPQNKLFEKKFTIRPTSIGKTNIELEPLKKY